MVKKQRLDLEKSVNKVIFSTISQLELPVVDKLVFLQTNDPETRINILISYLSNKTENLKGISELEDKVRKDLMPPTKSQSVNSSQGSIGGGKKTNEIDRIRQKIEEKDLPQHVRDEM